MSERRGRFACCLSPGGLFGAVLSLLKGSGEAVANFKARCL